MFCTQCGSQAEAADAFCSSCGFELRTKAAAPSDMRGHPTASSEDGGKDPRVKSEGAIRVEARAPRGQSQVTSREPVTSAERPPSRPAGDSDDSPRDGMGWVLVACGAVLIAGNWMSWYVVNDSYYSSHVSGNDLSAAAVPIFIIGGLILGGIGVAHVQGRAAGSALGVIAAVTATAAFVLAIAETNDLGTLEDEGFDAHVGGGLILMILVSLIAMGTGVALARRRSSSQRRTA